MSGIGIFKGKSLCLSQQDVNNLHLKFIELYKNKIARDQQLKLARINERKETQNT